jgi:hypothetical protein
METPELGTRPKLIRRIAQGTITSWPGWSVTGFKTSWPGWPGWSVPHYRRVGILVIKRVMRNVCTLEACNRRVRSRRQCRTDQPDQPGQPTHNLSGLPHPTPLG